MRTVSPRARRPPGPGRCRSAPTCVGRERVDETNKKFNARVNSRRALPDRAMARARPDTYTDISLKLKVHTSDCGDPGSATHHVEKPPIKVPNKGRTDETLFRGGRELR